jgi:catechol 2,3-dioxygenase-like lactoylglutathione lyase family enzyme
MLRAKALDHIGLIVTDMERSLNFYREALGLELVRRSGEGTDSASSAVLRVGAQEINLFCDPDVVARFRNQSQGIDHFCLTIETPSIDDLIRALQPAGIDIVRGPLERRDGTAVFVSDPDGISVELAIKK